jgi:hypothetical protein
MQHLSEKDVAVSVRNWKTADEHGTNDLGSDSEHNNDDYC